MALAGRLGAGVGLGAPPRAQQSYMPQPAQQSYMPQPAQQQEVVQPQQDEQLGEEDDFGC